MVSWVVQSIWKQAKTRFPYIVFWTGGTSEADTFSGLINMFPPILAHECYHLSVNQWFNVCTVVSSGNFRFLGGPDCYLSQLRVWIQLFLDSQYYFSFSGANHWASLVNFSKLSFGRASLWIMTEVWLLASLRTAFLVEICARWFPLTPRDLSLECPGNLVIEQLQRHLMNFGHRIHFLKRFYLFI